MEPTKLSTEQAGVFLGVSESTLEKWRFRGFGPAYHKYGAHRSSRVVYDTADLQAWAESQRRPSNHHAIAA